MFRLKYLTPEPVTCEELKSLYRKLAMANHPDTGGDAEAMKAINDEYEYLFSRLKNIHANAQGEKYTSTGSRETQETPEQFIEIIDRLIRFEEIKIEIIGAFIWVSGNTKVYKEELKEMGFKWHSKKFAGIPSRIHFPSDSQSSPLSTHKNKPHSLSYSPYRQLLKSVCFLCQYVCLQDIRTRLSKA